MIKIKKLLKVFDTNKDQKLIIYKNLDLEVKVGEFISILGTSGSGKTTLLNLISGLDSFEGGTININKYSLKNMTGEEKTRFRGKNISFIFQQFNLIDNLTVEENIDLVIDLNKLKRRYETKEILKIVGLENKINSYPYNLSGGEQQRVAVARAFIGETPILLADEPTGNLDKNNAKIIIELIKKLQKETNNTIVMITHDKSIADIADSIYNLENHLLVKQ